MRKDPENTRGLSWRNIAIISEKQRMLLSCPDWLAVEPVSSQSVSVCNSLEQGKIQGISGVSGRLAAVRLTETAIPRQFKLARRVTPFFENRELTGKLSPSGPP